VALATPSTEGYSFPVKFDSDMVFDVVAKRLPEEGVDCIMIGGHAVNHYGVTRATQDIDFMIAAADEPVVRAIMQENGFTNIATQENVVFFNKSNSSLRIDFLKVDRSTMDKLMLHAVCIEYFGGHRVKVPSLHDLLAMKIFAMNHGGARRQDKDMRDIVNLVVANKIDVETDLQKLCVSFGNDRLFQSLRKSIEECRHD
jgi:predicted nucleotidyltransferase